MQRYSKWHALASKRSWYSQLSLQCSLQIKWIICNCITNDIHIQVYIIILYVTLWNLILLLYISLFSAGGFDPIPYSYRYISQKETEYYICSRLSRYIMKSVQHILQYSTAHTSQFNVGNVAGHYINNSQFHATNYVVKYCNVSILSLNWSNRILKLK